VILERADQAPALLVGTFGGAPHGGGPGPGYRCWQWSFARGEKIEVLEPDGPDGFVQRFLARQGIGVHHVTFKVPDLRAACARAEECGYEIVGFNDASANWKEAFLHPKQAQGVVVQFAQTQESSGAEAGGGEWGADWKFPASPQPAPAPVTVRGLRVVSPSEEQAQLMWERVLGGAASANGALEFTWPDSPMRIAVEVDPAATPGPIAIELAGPEVELPAADPLSQSFQVARD